MKKTGQNPKKYISIDTIIINMDKSFKNNGNANIPVNGPKGFHRAVNRGRIIKNGGTWWKRLEGVE